MCTVVASSSEIASHPLKITFVAVTLERSRMPLKRWAKSTLVTFVRTTRARVVTTNVVWPVVTRRAAFMTSRLESQTVERRSAFHARSATIAADIWRIDVRRQTATLTASQRWSSARPSSARTTTKSLSETMSRLELRSALVHWAFPCHLTSFGHMTFSS